MGNHEGRTPQLVVKWWKSPRSSVQIHRLWLIIWIMLIPVSFWLKDQVMWVVLMSHWAILSGEASALLAARVEKKQKDGTD